MPIYPLVLYCEEAKPKCIGGYLTRTQGQRREEKRKRKRKRRAGRGPYKGGWALGCQGWSPSARNRWKGLRSLTKEEEVQGKEIWNRFTEVIIFGSADATSRRFAFPKPFAARKTSAVIQR